MSSELTTEEKRNLIELSRASIKNRLRVDQDRPAAMDTPSLNAQGGAFVTLHKNGRLRGCIGRFTSEAPLTDTVQEMARAAAFEDPRFPPLKAEEMDDIDLEISVLTPMTQIEDPEEIQVGRDGVYIVQGPHRGVLLPQVATEQGWDRQTFLEQTCRKAGLGGDCWRDPRTQIYRFSANVFGENELGR
jgi:AmmeMemoRadiSam system protein A